jgi:hypothetical protein
MNSKTSNQTKARLIVLSIFVIGFAAGALSMNLYQRSTSDAEKEKRRTERGQPQLRVTRIMTEKLNLTEDQQEKIKVILGETFEQYDAIRAEMLEPKMKEIRPRFEAARQQGRERIRALLTQEQLPKFEEMVEEQDRERAEGRRRR